MKRPVHKERVIALLGERGVMRLRDFIREGIPQQTVARMAERGEVDNPLRGVYTLPGAAVESGVRAGVATARTPKAVVCLLSAALHHGLVTTVPNETWLAIPRVGRKPSLSRNAPRIKFVRMESYLVDADDPDVMASVGIEWADLGEGRGFRVTGPARTVADLFRHVGTRFVMPDGEKQAAIHLDLAVEAFQTALANGVDSEAMLDMARLVGSERMLAAALIGGRSMRA